MKAKTDNEAGRRFARAEKRAGMFGDTDVLVCAGVEVLTHWSGEYSLPRRCVDALNAAADLWMREPRA